MVETFEDGTKVTREPTGLHYSEKGGHFWRGLAQRVRKVVAGDVPIRIETSWSMRRHMRRISLDGKR